MKTISNFHEIPCVNWGGPKDPQFSKSLNDLNVVAFSNINIIFKKKIIYAKRAETVVDIKM